MPSRSFLNSTALKESSPADISGSLALTSLPRMAATASWTCARTAGSETAAVPAMALDALTLGRRLLVGTYATASSSSLTSDSSSTTAKPCPRSPSKPARKPAMLAGDG